MTKRDLVAAWVRFSNCLGEMERLNRMVRRSLMTRREYLDLCGIENGG